MKQKPCIAIKFLTWFEATLKPLVLELENVVAELFVCVEAVCFLFGASFASRVDVDGLLLFINRIRPPVTCTL